MDRAKAVEYANQHWDIPCDDNVVNHIPFTTLLAKEMSKLANPSEWKPFFLRTSSWRPNRAAEIEEELTLVRNRTRNELLAIKYDSLRIPASDKIALWGWKGLLDCAHYVSRCLTFAGIKTQTIGVSDLIKLLTDRHDTKALAVGVPRERAKRILDAGIMKPGDVIAYFQDGKYEHSALYMGMNPAKQHSITCHTMSRHPDFDGDWICNQRFDDAVTLVHFSDDDLRQSSSMLGWWKITGWGQPYYYYFSDDGKVGYTSIPPTRLTVPLLNPEGKGYWFAQPGGEYIACWTKSGSVERWTIDPVNPNSKERSFQNGKWNDSWPFKGTKLIN